MNSSNFSKFIDNFWIIKRLYEDENKSIEFITRWLRMSKIKLLLWIDRYFKHLRKLDELNIKHKLKEERVNRIKTSIFEILEINRRRYVIVLQMVEHINNWVFKDNQDNKTNYYEVFLRKYIRGIRGISRIYFSIFLIKIFPKIYPGSK